MSFERLRRIADAVLFEGYVLYPYRASSRKNHHRFQFGVLAPPAWADGRVGEAPWMETQCLLEPSDAARLDVRLRFLHARRRRVEAARDGGHFEPVESLDVAGKLHLPWDEGEVREIELRAELAAAPVELPFSIAAARDVEPIQSGAGTVAGRLVREQNALSGVLRLDVETVGPGSLARVRVVVENHTPCDPSLSRDEALASSFLGAHVMLAATGGAFVSLLDPPEHAREAAAACKSVRTYPVLAGEPGARDLVLSAPIILYDHPQIAPESPGDLFDATEIDEILTLRTMLLTDEEKRQVRATDARGAAILDRIASMPPEVFERLHGVIRERRPISPSDGGVPTIGDIGPTELPSIRVGEVTIAPGSRVRIRLGARRTDAQDLFFDGLTAKVEKILRDVDGRDCVAVTVDDDPAAELHRWYGRFHYFYSDEIEPLGAGGSGGGEES